MGHRMRHVDQQVSHILPGSARQPDGLFLISPRTAGSNSPTKPLRLSLIGPISVAVNGKAVDLPRSKKARALLAYLAVMQRPQWREHLLDLLWAGPEGSRDRLRWTLSRLRKALEVDELRPIVTGTDTVAFDRSGAECDFWTLQEVAAVTPQLASTASLVEAAEAAQGEFLEGLDMPDCFEFRMWWAAERENLRRLKSCVLATLCDRLGATEQSLTYARKRVLVDPSETAHLCLLQQLIALGRRPEAEAHLATARRQFATAGLPPPYRLIRYWSDSRFSTPSR